MIKVKSAYEADICVSAAKRGFWVRGEFDEYKIDMHFAQALSVKYYLRNLERHFFSVGLKSPIAVFDMTERCMD